MKTVKMLITPEQAKEWLSENNKSNRRLSVPKAKMYKEIILGGSWKLTHQGIAFYEDGNIADGQHRLSGIALAGIAVESLVSFGIPKDAALAVDVGNRPRSARDAIIISGTGAPSAAMVGIAKMYFDLSQNDSSPSAEKIATFCNENAEFDAWINKNLAGHKKCVSTVPVKLALFSAFFLENKDRLSDFCKSLQSGMIDCVTDCSVIRLRERLLSDASFQGGGTGRKKAFLLTQRAIFSYCRNEPIKSLKIPNSIIYPL